MRKIIASIVVLIGFVINGTIAIKTSDNTTIDNTIYTESIISNEMVVDAAENVESTISTTQITETQSETDSVIITPTETQSVVDETIPETEPDPIETEPDPIETEPDETQPIITEYKYGRRMTPAVEINYENGVKNYTEEVDTSEYTYYGRMFITGYTPTCVHCCGSSKGITSSGVPAIPGYTVAAGYEFAFGTTLYIEGYGYYVVEDRGNLGENVLDIATPDHESCYPITKNGINVYIVSNKNPQQ